MPTEINEDMTNPNGVVSSLAPAVTARRRPSPGLWIAIFVVTLGVFALIVFGITVRASNERRLEKQTDAAAILTVNVVHPNTSGLSPEIALPGNTQAYMDTPIYARTSGYLKKWYFDIGAHVQKGQLMAQIETPELDEQLQVSEANLKLAQADLDLANTTSARYQNLLKTNSVSRQETDQAVSGASAKQAAVDAAMANVRRLKQLQSFEKVYAPFSGIVTVRNTDIGALIDAGSAAAPKELFHLAAIGRLRVYVAVPEAYSGVMKDGSTATLTLDEYPGQQFKGTIARNSSMIDPASRTLNVELDVDNADGKLLPGAYVFAHFKVPEHALSLNLPSNTLLFRSEGLRVGVVKDGRVHLAAVTIGRDNGSSVEIASGVRAQDAVIIDPSDSLAEGQEVHVAQAKAGAAKGSAE